MKNNKFFSDLKNIGLIYVGTLVHGGTCLQRMEAMFRLGIMVLPIDIDYKKNPNLFLSFFIRLMRKIGLPIDISNVNFRIIEGINNNKTDIIWIDKGLIVRPKTMLKIRTLNPKIIICGYSPDDMMQAHSQSLYFMKSLKYYDYFFTTKSYNVSELIAAGAKNPIFIPNAYDPLIHRPRPTSEMDISLYGGDVGFIGAWEFERGESILSLANAGIKIRWWGWGGNKSFTNVHENLTMENTPLWGEYYSRAINSFKINLCFLRKINRDLQTTRSIEIPACGGFMLAERTDEHLNLFEEGVEAEFFSSNDELIDKVKYYLDNPERRRKIANAGYLRCITSGYSNDERIKSMFSKIYIN